MQVVSDEAILHTTLARIVAPPRLDGSSGGSGDSTHQQAQQQGQRQGQRQGAAGTDAAAAAAGAAAAEEAAVLLKAAVDQMTQELCGLQAELPELWCVSGGRLCVGNAATCVAAVGGWRPIAGSAGSALLPMLWTCR